MNDKPSRENGGSTQHLFPISKQRGARIPRGKSHLEEDFAMALKFDDFPAPVREYQFHPTRKWRFDFAWPAQKVAVELEGGIWIGGRHNRPISMEGDMEKYNAAALLGWHVGRFSKRMVKEGAAIAWLTEAQKAQWRRGD